MDIIGIKPAPGEHKSNSKKVGTIQCGCNTKWTVLISEKDHLFKIETVQILIIFFLFVALNPCKDKIYTNSTKISNIQNMLKGLFFSINHLKNKGIKKLAFI